MNRIMHSRRFGLRLIRPAPVLAMLLTVCELPLPITQDVVAAAEDNIFPVITITSPADNSIFSSTTIIEGKVSDHALKNGDNLGSLSSLSVVAGQNRAQKGKILIDTAGKVSAVGPADPSGGDAKITYSADTGKFSIEMNTEDLDRGSINVRITALDRNGNSGVSLLTLVSDAPLVMFKNGDSGRQLSQDELIGQIHIEGTIADNKKNPNSIKEISSVSFQVGPVGGKFEIELDDMTLKKGYPKYYETSIDRLYAPGTAEDAKFILNTNGTFSSYFMVRDQDRDKVKNSRSLEIKIEVTDRNGRSDYKTYSITAAERSPQIRIVQPALSPSGVDYYYYSSNTKAVYLNGKKQTEKGEVLKGKILFEGSVSPNDGPKGPEVIELKLREQDGKIGELDLTSTFKPHSTVPGDKTFYQELLLGTVPGFPSGNLVLRLFAKDKKGSIATVIREFIDDKTPPNAFSDLKIVRGVSEVKYAKAGDPVTLKFSPISDTGAGVDLTSLKISGTHDDDSYNKELHKDERDKTKDISLDIKFPGAASPTPYPSEDITFTMSVADNVENITTGSKNFKYYHTAPGSATLKVTQQLRPTPVTASATSPMYLKAGDTIRASFESPRDLNLDEAEIFFQLGTEDTVRSRINKTSGTVNSTYWYDYTILDGDPNTPVGWKLKYVDLAGNSKEYSLPGTESTHFTVDTKLPEITAEDFDIKDGVSGATKTKAGIGDKIKLSFTIDEDQKKGVPPVVKLKTSLGDITSTDTPTETTSGDRTKWQVEYTVPQSTTSTGSLTLRSVLNPQRVTPVIRVEDRAGNTTTIDFSEPFDIDNTLPTFSAASPPTIKSSKTGSSSGTKAGIDDTITVNFTLSEPQKTGIKPVVSLDAAAGGTVTPTVTPVAGTGRKEWNAAFTVPEAGTVTPEYLGNLTLKVTPIDAFGNVNNALNNPFPTFSIDNTKPKFDETPTISSNNTIVGVDKPSTKAGIGDTITVNFTLSEPQETGSAPRVSLKAATGSMVDNTPAVTPVAGTGRKKWSAAFTVRESGTGIPATPEYSGDLTFKAVATDEFGNESDELSQVFPSDKFTIDNTRPTFTDPPTVTTIETSTSAIGIKQYPSGTVIEIKVTDVSDDARSVEFGFTGTGAPVTRYSAGKDADNTWSSYDASTSTSRPPVTLPTSAGKYSVTVKVVDGHGNEKNVTTKLQIEVIP